MLGEELVKFLAVVIAGSLGEAATDLTGDEYSWLPERFHLENLATCLTQSDGVYCPANLLVKPLKEPGQTYELMKVSGWMSTASSLPITLMIANFAELALFGASVFTSFYLACTVRIM